MDKIKNIAAVLFMAIFISSLMLNIRSFSDDVRMTYHDTVTIRTTLVDTVFYQQPVMKDSTVIRYVTLNIPDDKEEDLPIIEEHSKVVIPISQKTYTDDSTYTAYVSGYNPALDSIVIHRNSERITTVLPRPTVEDKKWSIGVQVGYGITLTQQPQFAPYIGIGITYKLFNI